MPVVVHRLKAKDFGFKVSYHSRTHKYADDYHVNITSDSPFPNMNKTIDDELEAQKQIYITLYELLKRKL